MPGNRRCNRCGNVLPIDAPEGICPACMLSMGLELDFRVAAVGQPGGGERRLRLRAGPAGPCPGHPDAVDRLDSSRPSGRHGARQLQRGYQQAIVRRRQRHGGKRRRGPGDGLGPCQGPEGRGRRRESPKQPVPEATAAGRRSDREALAKLSADEQKAWRTLWADVESLLKRAGSQR